MGLTPPQPRPQFTLTDTAGKPYKFGTATAGKPTLLYFGYTHCPDVCPTTLADITQALQPVPAAMRSATQVVFVTTDVKRDTPAVLKAYLAKFDAGLPNQFVGLTGTQAADRRRAGRGARDAGRGRGPDALGPGVALRFRRLRTRGVSAKYQRSATDRA